MLINASYFLSRVGTDAEMRKDRAFCSRLLEWQWRYNWRKAEAAGDYAQMDYLSRNYEMIKGL